jgi:hypothetical protein
MLFNIIVSFSINVILFSFLSLYFSKKWKKVAWEYRKNALITCHQMARKTEIAHRDMADKGPPGIRREMIGGYIASKVIGDAINEIIKLGEEKGYY